MNLIMRYILRNLLYFHKHQQRQDRELQLQEITLKGRQGVVRQDIGLNTLTLRT